MKAEFLGAGNLLWLRRTTSLGLHFIFCSAALRKRMPFQSGLGFVLICKNQLIKKIHQFIFDGIFILEKSGVLAANFFTHEKIFLQL
ncbi:hypothetical protein EGI11_07115 [Chryseobacterium sp. H3056]|uniref:Uncharacterized protein n=1 Tax=Kaistella daneshvariae TaxID=2487074 RepID=A0A3N0WW20_9FLAO|nr:hypothetical protein EGI11_07115 [Kaistella daneshvariae]